MWGESYLSSRESQRKPIAPVCASAVLHLLFLGWLLHAPTPRFISPSSVVKGEGGSSLTYLFRSDPAGNAEAKALSHEPLVLPAENRTHRRTPRHPKPAPESETEKTTASAAETASPPAGSRFGSLAGGPVTGSEVRPALRVSGSEPVVGMDELGGAEGNVIIEITIDEHGKIVSKSVIQSLGPAVDNKVLAALEDWHFIPATEDGVAIPSKEDVYYHFPVRR